jgi:hypothetical protein
MYAEECELGIDPTVKVVRDSDPKNLQYDYTVRVITKSDDLRDDEVENRIYRTDHMINYDGAKSLRGRGTRIWKVHQVVDEKVDKTQSGVLKDFWVDDDRIPETEILEKIKNQPDLPEGFKEMFLTSIATGDVYINDKRDSTHALIMRGAKIPIDAAVFPTCVPNTHQPLHTVTAPVVSDVNASTSTSNVSKEKLKIIQYFSKYHHRIIFAEERRPLSQSRSLREVFAALLGIIAGMLWIVLKYAFLLMCFYASTVCLAYEWGRMGA